MRALTFNTIDDTVLDTLRPPGWRYWLLIAGLFGGVLLGAGCWLYQILVGVGVAGMNNPVHWGTYLINFVFWVGIAHSGTLISAILHLFRAGWRNPIARAAETMTVFAVCTAGLFPFIHLGRAWMVYYMLPLPNQRTLWPNFQSPLMFDVVAISTYLIVSSLFWYTGMLPDLAIIRDRAWGVRKQIFTVLSLGWTGRHEQWRHYSRGYLSGYAAGDFGAQRRLLGLRPGGGARLAHHHLRPLLRGRCHPLGAGHGAYLDDSPAADLPL